MQASVVTGPGVFCSDPTFKSCDPHFERIHKAPVPVPTLQPGQALVKVAASSVNPADWKFMFTYTGILGKDFAGKVVATMPPCSTAAGALVWGDALANGAFAEYLAADCSKISLRPLSLTAAEAGALPHVSLAGLQALTIAGAPWRGSPSVLVLGGSGGTGHVGVQLARALGAGHVFTTCSASHAEMMRSLGVDRVIDYHTESWWEVLGSVDIIYDTVGEDYTGEHAYNVLSDGGFFVTIADGPKILASRETEARRPQVTQAFSALSDNSGEALGVLKRMVDTGALKAVIINTYDLGTVREAMEESRGGHSVGKLSVLVP